MPNNNNLQIQYRNRNAESREVNRRLQDLDAAMTADPIDLLIVEYQLEDLEKAIEELDSTNKKIRVIIDKDQSMDVDKEIQERNAIMQPFNNSVRNTKRFLKDRNAEPIYKTVPVQPQFSMPINLPKLTSSVVRMENGRHFPIHLVPQLGRIQPCKMWTS